MASSGSSAYSIHILNSPALSDIPMDRDLLSLKVGVAKCGVLLNPHIVETFVPGIVISFPAVAASRYAASGVIPFTAQVVDVPRLKDIGCRRL